MAHSPHLCRPSRVSSDHVSHWRLLIMAPPMRGFATHVRRGCTRSSPCIPATFCVAAATRRVCALAAKLCVQTKWHALPTHGVCVLPLVSNRVPPHGPCLCSRPNHSMYHAAGKVSTQPFDRNVEYIVKTTHSYGLTSRIEGVHASCLNASLRVPGRQARLQTTG